MAKYRYTLNYDGNYGYVEFDDETKGLDIKLSGDGAAAAKARVRTFLTNPQTMDIPGPKGLQEFETRTLLATDDAQTFKIVLTRLWVNTNVLVEWSMPPGSVDSL